MKDVSGEYIYIIIRSRYEALGKGEQGIDSFLHTKQIFVLQDRETIIELKALQEKVSSADLSGEKKMY